MKSTSKRVKLTQPVVLLMLVVVTFTITMLGLWSPNRGEVEPIWLGNPLREDGQIGRSLNVWDLQVFDGKIYLGGGSTVTNSGPINVWAFDPKIQDFVREYRVQEEAIEHYRVFDQQLYIPAADPTKGDRHKFYRCHGGEWQKYASSVVKLAHVRDLIKTSDNQLLMVGNSRQLDDPSSRGTAIAVSRPDGFKFEAAGVENVAVKGVVVADFNWFFSVFRYQDRIFATNSLLRDGENFPGAIAEYNPSSQQFVLNFNLRNHEFIPESVINSKQKKGLGIIYRPWHPVEFQGYLVYPVRSYSISPDNYEEAYMNSIGFFYKSDMGKSPQPLKLPKGSGEDVLLINGELYVLANRQNRDAQFINYIYKTDRLSEKTKWQRVVKFKSWNKARSFEYLDGTFYFGLGQDYDQAISNAGDILSYRPQEDSQALNNQ